MPNSSADLCRASAKCAPGAVTFGWRVIRRCLPEGRPCMLPRGSAPADARRSNHIRTGPALFSVGMAAAQSIRTAPLAAARTFAQKLEACIRANTLRTSFSVSKPWTSVSAAADHVRWKLQSVPRWRRCDFREPRNHAPASGWPRTAWPAGRGPLRHSAASSGPRCHRPAAQTRL